MIVLEKTKDFSKLLDTDKIVLVDFYADWCGPCKSLHPQLEKLENLSSDLVEIVKVNIEKHPSIASQYEVRSIPALFYHNEGEVFHHSTGIKTASEMKTIIESF